ncbi:MAG: aminoglycoside phosphotransferase family protein [Candidatus Competibacteraceae bacterium]|nr:aminoglycoside phosphotransferase family protein [Candidatus Competibacteraceae bacterium]
MHLQDLLPALRRRLRANAEFQLHDPELEPMRTTGLAHDHVRIKGTGRLLRIPKQSQLGLDAVTNLHYQAACFRRAAPSGHTPQIHAVLEPDVDLPMGALLVDEIVGPVIRLPDQLPLLINSLAALHALPLPSEQDRPPLKHPADPLADTVTEVLTQARYLDDANLHPDALQQIREELATARSLLNEPQRPPATLISFDTHPGNFIVQDHSHAYLVDLEKARYGFPGFDLAHATLYTSTTWDVATYAVLSTDELAGAYRAWLAGVPESLALASRGWLVPLRRVMWLWSVTWCAKWRVLSAQAEKDDKHRLESTEDWSAGLSHNELVRHVAERVADYLNPDTITRVRNDWLGDNALTGLRQIPLIGSDANPGTL